MCMYAFLFNGNVLIVVLCEDVEVGGVEGDVEVIVVAGLYFGYGGAASILERTEFEGVLSGYAFAGKVGIGGHLS